MKMQKSTMILSGVLGVASVGSVLMFANPGIQEALVSNMFNSRIHQAYVIPTKPATTNPWGVMPSKPSISGEVVIKPNATKGKYEGFMDGRLFITTENITKEAAYSNCTQNSSNNIKSSIRCTWNSIEIFSRPAPTKPSISGEVVIRPSQPPKPSIPATPVNTSPIEANLVIKVDGKITPTLYQTDYKLSETRAIDLCANMEKSLPRSAISCVWNGTKELSKGYGTKVVASTGTTTTPKPATPATPISTGSTSTGTLVVPKTPVSTGSINANLVIIVDGKNQPDIYNTYKLNEKEAINYCAELASRFPASSKFSCVWNGTKELSKGYGTRVVTNTGTTTTTTPKPTTPATPAGTGSSTSTGAIPLGTLTIKTDFLIDKSGRYNIAEIEAKAICESTWKKYESDPKSTYLTCIWNGKTIFSQVKTTPAGTGSSTSTGVTSSGSTTSLGKMDMWVNNQAWNPEYNISQSGALTRCNNYLPSIPTSSVVLCKWNSTTIYSGGGKQVVTQTNSGSTSSGSMGTGNAITTKKLTSSDIVLKSLNTENTTRTTTKIRYSITNNSSSDIVVYNHQFSFENPRSDTQDFSKVRFVGAFGADNTYLAEKVGSNLTFANQVGIKRGETKIFLFDAYAREVDSIDFYIDLISMYITDNNGTMISVAPQLRYKGSIYNK